ncbi:GTP cyclohydrolase FolE2 [Pseudomonas putida]|uniref:GTP cyclohydrolase FolE2 n=1 Tax=Pseudomonas putida TaxID=303 RepID=UPI0009A1AD33|nr:GTP cyclohydrolase FolE2 [Pseudomonas putida]
MSSMKLPDVAITEQPIAPLPLDWVGMEGIDLPIQLDEPGISLPIHAKADVQVDLPNGGTKGIHMSRLYRLLDELSWPRPLSPTLLQSVMAAMVASHEDCQATGARLRLSFDLLASRPALITEGLAGWKAYPAVIEATLKKGQLHLRIHLDVGYSSTCPCSAALSRQIVESAFLKDFAGSQSVTPEDVAVWLRKHATAATPHSQRSVAAISVVIDSAASSLGLLDLADRTEAALGTPVQTAVKRADEQEFARLNGSNLMYVEDATRKLQQALAGHYEGLNIYVSHKESLHPHDAVAWSSIAL